MQPKTVTIPLRNPQTEEVTRRVPVIYLAKEGDLILNEPPGDAEPDSRGYYRITHVPTGRVLVSYMERDCAIASFLALSLTPELLPEDFADIVGQRNRSAQDARRYFQALKPFARAMLPTGCVEAEMFSKFLEVCHRESL